MRFKKWNIMFFVVLLLFSTVGYLLMAYCIPRSESYPLLLVFFVLCFLFYLLMRFRLKLKMLFLIGVFFRLLFLLGTPSLSQDFYRFLWDGTIQLFGINPYLFSPDTLLEELNFPLKTLLHQKMGSLSAMHYSSYPPFIQGIYLGVMAVQQDTVLTATILLRLLHLGFEILLFVIGIRLLHLLKLPPWWIGWYYLNPLVIVELSGNLHAEGIMLGLFLTGIYFVFRKQLFLGAFFLSLSIATKLIPLLVLPVFFYYLGWRRFFIFGALTITFSLLLWLPFLEQNSIIHFVETVRLWFNRFEFNGSLYYIVREIGYEIKGYNIIRRLGKITPFIVSTMILGFAFLAKNRNPLGVLKSMLWVLSIYFFMSTTVHPWYIISLVVLGISTGYAYPIVWSTTVFLSYTAYANAIFQERMIWIFVEYICVYGCLFYELFKRPLLHHFQKTDFTGSQMPPLSTG